MSDENLYDKGMKIRRAVLGNDYVDRAEAGKTDLDKEFQEYITSNAWGTVWSRPGLTRRERSMITIALLSALGHEDELALHLKATRNTNTSREDVKEVLLHTAVYAGVPAVNKAFKIVKDVLNENK